MINESIIGIDVSVTSIEPRQNFASSFANLPQISREIYDNFVTDEKFIDRLFTKVQFNEFMYYNTSLFWMRIIDLKAKQGRVALTTENKEIRKTIVDKSFNIPQPIVLSLSQIGDVTNKIGKEQSLTYQ